MCFSAEASFVVGGALIPAGGYCIWQSIIKKPEYLGLAAVPLFFGIQQISEGFVWQAMLAEEQERARQAGMVFLFFALAFWPFWFPVLSALMEPDRGRQWVLGGIALLTTAWFWVLYYPLLANPYLLTVAQVEHSVQYQYSDLAIYQYVSPDYLRILYFMSVAMPMLLSSHRWARVPGIVLGASAVFAAIIYSYTFVSVWCFFAAVLAVYCCWIFYHLPRVSRQAQIDVV